MTTPRSPHRPVVREIPADLETPVSAFLKLKEHGARFLLESVEMGLELKDLMVSDAVEQIRAMKRRWQQRTKVLFTAARDAAADDARVLGLADGRVPKPFESERITQKLRELGLPL